MPSILDRVNARHAARQAPETRKGFTEPNFWQLDALRHALVGPGNWAPDRETIEHDFEGYAAGAGKASAPVFACCYARLRVFADGNFLWRDRAEGQLGAFYDSPDLAMLRRPWPGGTLQNLLGWMEVDATYAGNSFETTCDDRGRFGNASRGGPGRRIVRLRPDWVTLVIGSHSDDPYALDSKVVGIIYEPPLSGLGGAPKSKPVVLLPGEVCHYAPVPDPIARFRGMSWLTPVLREVSADLAATQHKLKRFEQGATLQTVVSLDKDVSPEAFDEFVARFKAGHEGTENAYKTLVLGGGADVTVVGADMQKLDFKNLQGAGETRIAAAAGVHPVVVGLSEGLSGSSLNAGNYSAARRNVADGTLQHLWGEAASSLETLFERPKPVAELCIDKRDVAFVREDAKDIAEIQSTKATALRSLLDAGYEPDAAVEFLESDDISRLAGKHSGMFSVQLQPPGGPGEAGESPPPEPSKRGPRQRFKYDATQPRDNDGQWSNGGGGSAADPLKLAGRIRLGTGERFGGSARVIDGRGDSAVAMARVDRSGGSVVRLGVVDPDDVRKWRAEDKGATVELDVMMARRLRDAIADLTEKARKGTAASNALTRRLDREGATEDEYPDIDELFGTAAFQSNWGQLLKVRAERTEGDWYVTVDPHAEGSVEEGFVIYNSARVAAQFVKALDNLLAEE